MIKNYDSLNHLHVEQSLKFFTRFLFYFVGLDPNFHFVWVPNRKSTCFTTIILLFSMYTLAVGVGIDIELGRVHFLEESKQMSLYFV